MDQMSNVKKMQEIIENEIFQKKLEQIENDQALIALFKEFGVELKKEDDNAADDAVLDEADLEDISGGRWKCDNCGRVFTIIGQIHLHLSGDHMVLKSTSGKGINGARWAYHWVW